MPSPGLITSFSTREASLDMGREDPKDRIATFAIGLSYDLHRSTYLSHVPVFSYITILCPSVCPHELDGRNIDVSPELSFKKELLQP